MDGALEEKKKKNGRKKKKTGHQRRPPQEPAAPYGRVLSAGQGGFVNIDESLSASPLRVIVPRRVFIGIARWSHRKQTSRDLGVKKTRGSSLATHTNTSVSIFLVAGRLQ